MPMPITIATGIGIVTRLGDCAPAASTDVAPAACARIVGAPTTAKNKQVARKSDQATRVCAVTVLI
jgi:hypothetical protein